MSAKCKPKAWLIHVRFDVGYGTQAREIFRCNLPQVPAFDQIINLNGDPFAVQRVGWAIDERKPDQLFAFVTVRRDQTSDVRDAMGLSIAATKRHPERTHEVLPRVVGQPKGGPNRS